MTMRSEGRGWAGTVVAALLAGGLGLSVVGCNGSSGGSVAAQGEAMAAASIQGGAIPSLLAIQQALAETQGATVFPNLTTDAMGLCGSATTAGGTASGTVTLAFTGTAGCSSPYGRIDGGSFVATYSTPATNTVAVATTFANTFFATATGSDDEQTVDGSVTTTLAVNPTAKTASGRLDGTIRHTARGRTRTLDFALSDVSLDSSNPSTPTATLNGEVTIDDPELGHWTVKLTDLVVDFTGCITHGKAKATRLDILTFEFTSCKKGNVLLAGIKVGTFRW